MRGWPAGATCSSQRASCACSSTTPSRLAGPRRGRPGRRPGVALPARRERVAGPCAVPGHQEPGRDPGCRGRRALRAVDLGHSLGSQPGERRFLGRGRGSPDPGGTLAEPVREVTVASTLQRMLQSVVEIGRDLHWLPGVAAGQTLAIADMAAQRRLARSAAGRARGRGCPCASFPWPIPCRAAACPMSPFSEVLFFEPGDSFFEEDSLLEPSPLWASAPLLPEPLPLAPARESVL